MPTVQYQPDQVRTQVAGTTQSRVVDNGGQQLAQGINSLANFAGEMKQQKAIASAQQAATMFEREKNKLFFDPQNGYFNTSGRNAVDAAETTYEQLDKLREQYASGLDDVTARNEFERVAQAQLTRSQEDIMRHSSKNLKAWEQSNIEAEVENTLEEASLYWNNLKQLDTQLNLGRQAVIDAGKMQGLSPEALNEKLETYSSAFALNVIQAATQSSAADGEKAMELWSMNLEGPDKLKLDGVLEAKRKSERTSMIASEAVVRAGNLVATYGGQPNARTAILEEVNKIDDPELRKAAMSEATYQLNLKQQADSEERQAIFREAESARIEPGRSIEMFKANNPDAWNKLLPEQQRALESPGEIRTDYIVYTKLRGMTDEQIAKIDPTQYLTRLAKPEYDKILSRWEAARKPSTTGSRVDSQPGRTQAAQTTAAVEQIFGNENSWNNTKREKVQLFYEILDGEVSLIESQKGSSLTSKEYTEVLNQLTREVTIDSGRWFLPNTDMGLEDFDADVLRNTSAMLNRKGIPVTTENIYRMQSFDISNISRANVDQISEYLIRNNVPVNVQTIYEAYNQATSGSPDAR